MPTNPRTSRWGVRRMSTLSMMSMMSSNFPLPGATGQVIRVRRSVFVFFDRFSSQVRNYLDIMDSHAGQSGKALASKHLRNRCGVQGGRLCLDRSWTSWTTETLLAFSCPRVVQASRRCLDIFEEAGLDHHHLVVACWPAWKVVLSRSVRRPLVHTNAMVHHDDWHCPGSARAAWWTGRRLKASDRSTDSRQVAMLVRNRVDRTSRAAKPATR